MTSTGTNQAPHVPVLVKEVIGALAIHSGETLVDGTFGAGGYTQAMLAAGAGRVIGFDRDPEAIEAGQSLVPLELPCSGTSLSSMYPQTPHSAYNLCSRHSLMRSR